MQAQLLKPKNTQSDYQDCRMPANREDNEIQKIIDETQKMLQQAEAVISRHQEEFESLKQAATVQKPMDEFFPKENSQQPKKAD
jgi:hypothetical protein